MVIPSVEQSVETVLSADVHPRFDPGSARLRVMHVVLSLGPGGTERLVIEIVKQHAAVADSMVCCLEEPGAWAGELTRRGVPVVSLGRTGGFEPRLGYAIARLSSLHKRDVLHCHHYSPFVYGQIGALLDGRVQVVFTEHGRLSHAPPSWKRRLVNPALGRLPAAIFAVSEDLRGHMIAEGLPPGRVRVVHNGIDPGPLASPLSRRAARRALGIANDTPVVGTVGRLDQVKDLGTLIEAFALVRRSEPDARLVIIGDGSESTRLEECATELGARDGVLFVGHRDDARDLLAAFDMYANSSVYEGISLTILEAMAAGLPVVATRVGGTPEIIDDEHTGLLVPMQSPLELAAAIETLLASPSSCRSLGRAARHCVETRFSLQGMAARYLAAYRDALRA
jgi:glycosyltransferase involved in cell wall biosynthesis